MREIIFRGKRKDNSKWVTGRNIVFSDGEKLTPYIIPTGTSMLGFDSPSYSIMMSVFYEIIPETVGQYTGLTDKNSKKIFEGDIVKIYLYEPKGLANYEIGCIKYDDIKARFVFCTEKGNYGIDNSNVFEVIGNIHDNPELLKGGAE